MRLACLLTLALTGMSGLAGPAARAQAGADPFRFVLWPVNDVRAIGSLHPKALLGVAGLGAGLFLLSRYDRPVTQAAADVHESWPIRVSEEFGNASAVRPALAVVLLGSLMTGNERLQDAAFTSLESVILANLATNSIKTLSGRARPWQEEGPGSIEPFSGNTSFPSGHATTAFAALTPFAQYYGGVRGVLICCGVLPPCYRRPLVHRCAGRQRYRVFYRLGAEPTASERPVPGHPPP
ncbi:MAG: membrane-associated phospholipid phosphatase [Rhodothermales bacterium]|jgi:membrane-associated phospholipid phosphatase